MFIKENRGTPASFCCVRSKCKWLVGSQKELQALLSSRIKATKVIPSRLRFRRIRLGWRGATSNYDPVKPFSSPRPRWFIVLGEVNKPGAYVLNSTGAVTLLQLVAAPGGPTHAGAVGGTRMIRRTPTRLQELPVPLKALLRGKTADIPISADDNLFVPSSRMKNIMAAGTIVATGTATAAIYHVF